MSLLVLAPAAGAQKRPDFTGRWVAISPGYTGQELRIQQARGTLKVTHAFHQRGESVTYNLDGTPRREPSGPAEERWSTAAWKNGTLVLTETRLTRTTEQRTEQTLSFDSSRRLIFGVTRTQRAVNPDPAAPAPVPERKTVIVLRRR